VKKVLCNGKQVTLRDSDFLSSGGEGEIYKKDGLIYKVYINRIDQNKEKKLKFLSILSKDNIISPKDILYSASNEPVGYTMNLVDNSSSLALLFTNSFKKRNSITSTHLEKIFLKMSETIKYIHEKDIIIVDGNELNYLISNSDFSTPYFIDVDSYETKDFPATVIMPSIRDFCTKGFSENTDWYSFAILMFQLYVGIHPYKGYHPKYNIVNYNGVEKKVDNLEERCKNKVSIYNSSVKYPPFVDLNNIPSNLNDWFISIFEKGERTPPPNIVSATLAIAPRMVINYSQGVDQTLLNTYSGNISRVFFIRGQMLVITENNYYYNNQQYNKKYHKEVPLIVEEKGNIAIYHVSKGLDWLLVHNRDMDEQKFELPTLQKVMYSNNRLFALTDDQLLELEINPYTHKLSTKESRSVLANASKFFMNCMYCDSFGNALFYIPEVKEGNNVLHVIKVTQLNSHKIIDAYYENSTLITISKFKSDYYKTLTKFDEHFIKNEFVQETCNLQEVNATVISNGMSLVIEEDTLEISAKYSVNRKKVNVNLDMQLSHKGNEVLGFRNNELYSLSLKKGN